MLPKPLVEIGGHPVLLHILRGYAHHGLRRFVLALGYRADAFLERFGADRGEALGPGAVQVYLPSPDGGPPWEIRLVDTGPEAGTGARVRGCAPYLDGPRLLLTYGDGLSDASPLDLLAFHRRHGQLATVTAVFPPPRFGHLRLQGDRVEAFQERPREAERFISGGFFAFERGVLDYIPEGVGANLEVDALPRLAAEGQLMAHRHTGFFECMDTYRDYLDLNARWDRGERPWAVWEHPPAP